MTDPDLIALTRTTDRPAIVHECELAARAAVEAQTHNTVALTMMNMVHNRLVEVGNTFHLIVKRDPQKGDSRLYDEFDRLFDDYNAAASAWNHFQERFAFVSDALLRRVSRTAHATTETEKEAWE